MGIENKTNLFGLDILSKTLGKSEAPKAFKDQNAYELNKILTSQQSKPKTDEAKLTTSVSPKATSKPKSTSSESTGTAHRKSSPAKSWQDQMGKDVVENGKILYDVDAKNYASKADYNKAIDEAIAKRDAALKGDPATASAAAKQDSKMTVAEGPNAGKPAEMAPNAEKSWQQEFKDSAVRKDDSTAGGSKSQAVADAENLINRYSQGDRSITSEQVKDAYKTVLTADQSNNQPAGNTQPPAAPAANQTSLADAQSVMQRYAAGDRSITSDQVNAAQRQLMQAEQQVPAASSQATQLASDDPGIAQAAERFYGQPQQGALMQASYPAQDPGNYQGRYVTGQQSQAESGGFLGSLSKPMVGIGGLLLGGIAGYFMGKNSAESNNDDAGYGSYGGYYDA